MTLDLNYLNKTPNIVIPAKLVDGNHKEHKGEGE